MNTDFFLQFLMDGNNSSNNKIPTSFSDSFSVSSPPQLQLPLENVPQQQQPATKQTTFQQPQQLPQQDDEGLESGDEDAGPNKKKRKRYHAKKACANCRRAHTACEDERPCKRCRKKGVSCFDAEPETMIQGTPDHLAYLKAATQLGMVNPNLMGALSGFDASTLSAAVNNPMNTPTNMFEQQQQQLQTNTYSDLFASQQALNMAQLKMEVMQLKEYTRKQDQMLSTCISKIAELQKVIVQQTEILGQISQQQSEIQLQRAQQGTFPSFANAPIWFNILPQLQNASSVWDKQQLTFLGCNEAFSKLCNYEPEELKELKLFSFATLRTAPFSEVLMLSLINSGARYAELKALWVIKGMLYYCATNMV